MFTHPIKEEGMTEKEVAPDERAVRGKRLLIFGMFSLVVVTIVAVFLVLYLLLAPLGQTSIVIQSTLIIGAVAIVACVIIWFVYTKLILKD
jgi:ABC-type tungstate transport system substrate-binding protein